MSDRQSENRAPRVKNRAPAAVQIIAEPLLREAQERQESAFKAPRRQVEDFEELQEYRGRKRKEFEERIRRTRGSVKEWQAYAFWEASRGDMIGYDVLTGGIGCGCEGRWDMVELHQNAGGILHSCSLFVRGCLSF